MDSTFARLSVNAAFLAEMKESHAGYQECLISLRDFCDANCSTNRVVSECGQFLHRMRDVFATQCELEETYGYVRVSDSKTRTSQDMEIQQTFAQHRQISLLLMELSERFDGLQYQGTLVRAINPFLRDLRSLQALVEQHEATERDLIRSAMSTAKRT
jgi:hypothetical protein